MNNERLGIGKDLISYDFEESLTSRQKDVLIYCLRLGYYNFPKKINLIELSKKIGISPSTLCVHLQKIESKFFNSVVRI